MKNLWVVAAVILALSAVACASDVIVYDDPDRDCDSAVEIYYQ